MVSPDWDKRAKIDLRGGGPGCLTTIPRDAPIHLSVVSPTGQNEGSPIQICITPIFHSNLRYQPLKKIHGSSLTKNKRNGKNTLAWSVHGLHKIGFLEKMDRG